MKWLRTNAAMILWAAGALLAWKLAGRWLEGQAAVVGAEFLTRAAVKVFYVALAAILTLHCDKWVAPTISKWADDNFARKWQADPSDPRLALCVRFYVGVFIGLCIVFAL